MTKKSKAEREAEERLRIGNTPTDDSKNTEALFEAVQEAQTAFWQAVADLEAATGLEIDSTRDLSDVTLDDLLNEDGE